MQSSTRPKLLFVEHSETELASVPTSVAALGAPFFTPCGAFLVTLTARSAKPAWMELVQYSDDARPKNWISRNLLKPPANHHSATRKTQKALYDYLPTR